MNAHLNDDLTCNTAFLAELFDCTVRNIGHYIDKGMPVLEYGKAGREHVFNGSHATAWYFGMRTCEQLGKRLPGPLETVLVGLFSKGQEMAGETFNIYQKRARKVAKDMGYSDRQYDAAIDYLLANRLLLW